MIKYVESFEDDRYMYVVTEYIPESKDLHEIIVKQYDEWSKISHEGRPLFSENDVKHILRMTLQGLNHIHAKEIIHKDIKPANLLFDSQRRLKIIDFGLSIDRKDLKGEKNGIKEGTNIFLPPEVFISRGKISAYNKPLDIWACGVMMYLLLAGKYPFSNESAIKNNPLRLNISELQ